MKKIEKCVIEFFNVIKCQIIKNYRFNKICSKNPQIYLNFAADLTKLAKQILSNLLFDI